MLLGLLGAVLLAPLYWLLAPRAHRREAIAGVSFAALAAYDLRLAALVLAVAGGLFALMRTAQRWRGAGAAAAPAVVGLAALAALFVWNKSSGREMAILPTQGGLAFLGVSYLVLKASAALIEVARGGLGAFSPRDVLAWIVFLPTYPSGPMEELEHFSRQRPAWRSALVLAGLERILFGLAKALLAAHYLGEWSEPILRAPAGHARWELLLALHALSLRFYFDFAGYSDIAIGLGAVYGYEIEENFDNPLVRRNLVQLWQRWHMTLTRWLRLYLFIPVSRRVLRYGGWIGEHSGIAAGQIVAMTFCGLWHGIAWNFALWGFVQALGLIWVGVACREIGRHMPKRLVGWWRGSPIAYALGVLLTFNAFSMSCILLVTDASGALAYLRLLLLG